MKTPTQESIATAAQCWCDDTTKSKTMDVELATVFALRLDELKELHNMKEVAIMTASMQNSDSTIKDRINRDDPYWTVAYDDMCKTVDREIRERKRAEKAEAALKRISEFDKESIWSDDRDDAANEILSIARQALGVELVVETDTTA